MSTQPENLGASLLKAVEDGKKKSDVEKLFKDINAAAVKDYVNYQDRRNLSPLLLASCLGHTEIVEFLLEKGAFVDMVGIDRMTALSAASESGHHGIVEKLAEAGANIDHVSHSNLFTPLMLASRYKRTETVKVLLDLKANANLTTEYSSCTALMLASKAGHAEVVEKLLPHVTKVIANQYGLTPLMFASANGHAEVARLLLENNKSQVNQRCSNGYTSLLLASYFGHDKVAEVLIEYGANIDMRTRNGNTALIEACSHGHVQFVKVLLDHNAEVNLRLYNRHNRLQAGATALMIACQNNNLEIIKLLLREDNGELSKPDSVPDSEVEMSEKEAAPQENPPQADVNLQDYYGRTALSYACEKGDLEIVLALVNHGAKVNPSSTGCVSPLLHAVRRENVDIVRVLLENGANPNPPKDRDGGYNNTPPLIMATLIENVDIVELLLSHKANVNVSTKLPNCSDILATPLLLAILAGCHKLVEIFVQNGANVLNHFKCKQDDGHQTTLVDLAKACGDTKIIHLLQSESNTVAVPVGNDTSDDLEPQAKRQRLNDSEDNSVEKSCKEFLSSSQFQSLDSNCPRRTERTVPDLFPSDGYTSLLKRLRPTSPAMSFKNNKPIRPLSVLEAYNACSRVSSEWRKLGIQLNIEPWKLQQIKKDEADSEECLIAMFTEWLENVIDPKPSWDVLAKGVGELSKALAQNIRDNNCP